MNAPFLSRAKTSPNTLEMPSDHAEDAEEHGFGEAASVRVLLAGMIGGEERGDRWGVVGRRGQ